MIGQIVHWHVMVVNSSNRECVWIEEVKEPNVEVIKYWRENVISNHVLK